jgi:O-antigen/teichoic acid export membrane protein
MGKVIKNTIIYTLGNLLPQIISFILLPVYSKFLSPNEFGVISAMTTVQAIMALLFSLSLERAILRLYWDYKTKEDKMVFLGTVAISMLVISMFVLILFFTFHNYVQLIFREVNFSPYYILAVISTFFLNFSLLPRFYFRVKGEAAKYLSISALELFLNTSFVLYFLIIEKEGALGVLKGRLIATLIQLPLFLYITIRKIKFKVDLTMLKECMKFCLPIIPTLIASWIIGQIDTVFIARYLTLTDVGIYSLSKRLASILTMVSGSFMLAYHPLYFELVSSSDKDNAYQKLYKYNNTFVIIMILFCFFLVLFSKEFIQIFLNERYFRSYIYIPVIAVSFLIGSISSTVIGASFQQSKKMKEDMYFGLLGALFSFISCYTLIKPFGINGAVLGFFLATTIIFLLAYFYSKKNCYYIPFDWKSIISSVIILGSIIGIFLLAPKINIGLAIFLKVSCSGIIIYFYYIKYYKTALNIIKYKPNKGLIN